MSKDDDFRPSGESLASKVQLQARNPPHDTPHIDILPPELLVQMMEEIRLAERRAGRYGMASPWILTYQLVCRRWRDVIRSTPSLWQEIIVYGDAKWLEFCLRRCAGALATVYVWYLTKPEQTFGTLYRAYHVHCDVPTLDYVSGLPLLLSTLMPTLETLSLTSPYNNGEDLDVAITHDLVPRLTSLKLRNCTAPGDIAVYTHLRSLTFHATTWMIPYTEFLDMLENCHDLERLSLDDEVLHPFAEELVNLPAGGLRRRIVVLPRLRAMKLTGQRALLSHLLATMHAPRVTTIELRQCIDDDERDTPTTHLLAADSQVRYPLPSSPRAISIVCWDRKPFHLSIQCESDSKARFSVDYRVWASIEWASIEWTRNVYMKGDFIAILEFFSIASVDTLKVEGYLESVAAETWQRAFRTLPNLRTLHVQGMGTLDSLWRGLACATTSSLERGGAMCCPSLSEIVVDASSWRASPCRFEITRVLFHLIPGVLYARANAGGARLQKFQL